MPNPLILLLAGGEEVESPFTESESVVLPLNDPPVAPVCGVSITKTNLIINTKKGAPPGLRNSDRCGKLLAKNDCLINTKGRAWKFCGDGLPQTAWVRGIEAVVKQIAHGRAAAMAGREKRTSCIGAAIIGEGTEKIQDRVLPYF